MIIQAVLAIIIVILLVRGVIALRKRQLSIYVSSSWVMLWVGALIIVLWPDITSGIAAFVGIGRGADLVIYLSILTIFGILFRILVHFDHIDERITTLARSIALKEYERTYGKKRSDFDPHA